MKKPLRPIRWNGKALACLDQRLLPFREKWITCRDAGQVARVIVEMVVRGAPLIGITAAYGVALEARKYRAESTDRFTTRILRAIDRLAGTRPTAVNLFWALRAMKAAVLGSSGLSSDRRAVLIEREARFIHAEDEALCAAIGCHGASLLKGCRDILTHCNTGALATGGEGTALAAILRAHRANRRLHVWVDETRPYLQGARLTAFELHHAGVRFDLITDNMAAYWMGKRRVDAVIVGADRIAANGDTANKIGTYSIAVLARAHGIPFYVAAPTSTFDLSIPHGGRIPIEERSPREVTHARDVPVTCPDYPARNPSFDVTPGKWIRAIVCEHGIVRPPYPAGLRRMAGKGNA